MFPDVGPPYLKTKQREERNRIYICLYKNTKRKRKKEETDSIFVFYSLSKSVGSSGSCQSLAVFSRSFDGSGRSVEFLVPSYNYVKSLCKQFTLYIYPGGDPHFTYPFTLRIH